MYAMLDATIAERRKGEGFQEDFLQSLLKKHSKDGSEDDEDDNKLTDKQLKDNILTLLVAGHDTTTAALTWLIKFLAENPAVLERLRVIFFVHSCNSYDNLIEMSHILKNLRVAGRTSAN